MGRSSWRLGPRPGTADSGSASPAITVDAPGNHLSSLSGSDLYRLNCQGCHGADGRGAPPEINSVINPVRATSAALVLERMKSAGMDMSAADARNMAREANAALLQRLHSGGQNMPAFGYLTDAEIHSLIGYLKELADMPGAAKQEIAVRETSVRTGELIVKSTCHICHDATGLNPGSEDLLQGAIPPLSTFTTRTTEAGLIRKVTHGAPIAMGPLGTISGGRMPVFHYLTEDEAANVYFYLTQYPPEDSATPPGSPIVQRAQASGSAAIGDTQPPQATPPTNHIGTTIAIVFSLSTAFAFGLITTGFVFTFREFARLTKKSIIVIPQAARPYAETDSEFALSVEDERKPA